MFERIGTLGLAIEQRFRPLRASGVLAYLALKAVFVERGRGRRVVLASVATQVHDAAIRPLPFFVLGAVALGFLSIVEADAYLPALGLHHLVPAIVTTGLVREVGPLVVAMAVAGRTGTAIVTELGNMRLDREVDALEAAGINIDYFLVLPRVVGVAVATCCLIVAFATAGIVGGFLLAEALGIISLSLIFQELVYAVRFETIVLALVKGLVFGVAIAAIACQAGLAAGAGRADVSAAAGRGVGRALATCFVLNAMVSVIAIL